MKAPNIAINVNRGTPSQSARAAHTRDSSISVSPTSKNTARTLMPSPLAFAPSDRGRPWHGAGSHLAAQEGGHVGGGVPRLLALEACCYRSRRLRAPPRLRGRAGDARAGRAAGPLRR